MMKENYMRKGAPITRSALTGTLRLELTYRDPSVPQRTEELQNENQQQQNVTGVPVNHHSPDVVKLTTQS
jgi:hypothetical protein